VAKELAKINMKRGREDRSIDRRKTEVYFIFSSDRKMRYVNVRQMQPSLTHPGLAVRNRILAKLHKMQNTVLKWETVPIGTVSRPLPALTGSNARRSIGFIIFIKVYAIINRAQADLS